MSAAITPAKHTIDQTHHRRHTIDQPHHRLGTPLSVAAMGSSFVSHSPALFAMESANSESEVSESDRPVKGARGWSASPRRARQPSSRKKPRRERQPSSPKRTWREREPCSRQTPRHEGEPCWRQTQGGPPPQKDCSLGVYVLDVNHVQSDEQMTQAAKVAPAKIMVLTKAPRCFTHRLKSETTRDERHERTKWVVKRGNSDPHDDCVCVAVRYDERSHRAASSIDPLPAPDLSGSKRMPRPTAVFAAGPPCSSSLPRSCGREGPRREQTWNGYASLRWTRLRATKRT